ncbi:TolC family protein [bacterium]|nr:TolC family protein [bacterium]
MQTDLRLAMLMGLILLLILPLRTEASEYTSVEIGSTRQYLRNQATSQPKHYLPDDEALDARIGTVIGNMDELLAALHALPPELDSEELSRVVNHEELLELVNIALDNNPELRPYRTQLGIQAARTRQAGAMRDPMLMFNLMNFPAPQLPIDDTPMTMVQIGMSQSFEGYGKRKLRRNIRNLEEQLTQYSLAQRELDLVGQVSDVYFEMMETEARLRILEENIELMQVLIELAGVKAGLGYTSQAMLIDSQLELSKMTERRVLLNSMLAKQRNRLAGLLGNDPRLDAMELKLSASYPITHAPGFDNAELFSESLERRPDYLKLDLMEYQQDLMVELASRGYRPDYTISTSIGLKWGMRNMVSAGITMPLFTNKEDRQDAELQEARAERALVDDKKAQLTNNLETQITGLELALAEDSEIIDLYRDVLVPQARLGLESELRSYAAEGAQLDELLKSQLGLLNLQQELELRNISYLANLARLQILTAGAFDPAPYLLGEPAFSDLMDGVSELAREAAASTADETVAREVNPFIEELDLPDDIPPISYHDDDNTDTSDGGNGEGSD